MGTSSVQLSDTALENFYDYLYGATEGYVYAATKEIQGNDISWKQHFFAWPLQRDALIEFTVVNRSRRDVYTAPALFRDRVATKDYVLGADVVWVEFDKVPPTELDGVPPPTCRVQSGGDGHEHWYWKLDRSLTADELEDINRALTYKFGADESGWDSTQVLRPPATFNHKRQRETAWVFVSETTLDPNIFSSLPPPPVKVEAVIPESIPPVEEVVAKYQFQETVRDLFFTGGKDRSGALMALGYHLAEMSMTKPEILSCLLNADERWGKFKGRDDRLRRLMEIVNIAVAKYPPKTEVGAPSPTLVPMGFKSLLAAEVNLEWQWEGFLQRAGYFLLTGPSGVGKTMFSLDAAGHMALGKDFLGKPVKQARIGFFSLEMGLVDLKFFLEQMQYSFTQHEQDILEEQLQFFPLGEPLYMTNDTVRAEMDQIVGDLGLDGIIVDSLGSATDEEVSDEKFKKFFHWNDTFRQRHDVFTWYIHHHRKADGSGRKPNKLADVYGSQYITSYATTVMCLWDAGVPNVLQALPLKMRLAEKPPPFDIGRDANLHFTRLNKGSQQLGNSGQSDPSGNHPAPFLEGGHSGPQAPHTGQWSTGPVSFAPEVGESEINLDMGGMS